MSVYLQLGQYLRWPYYSRRFSSGQSTHDALKAQLYVLGFRLGYFSVPEALTGDGDEAARRVDCVFLRRGDSEPMCGIEVDSSVRENSLVKLLRLGAGVEKVIVVYGSESSWEKMEYPSSGYAGVQFFRISRSGMKGVVES